MRNITLTAEEATIDLARERASAENTTLNEQFRLWLADYAHQRKVQRYEEVMAGLRGKVVVGPKPTRDEMHDR